MDNRAPQISFLVILGLLMAAFLVIIRPFLMPAMFAIIIVMICGPINRFFLRILHDRKYIAAFLATLMVILCVVLPMGLIIGVVVSKSIEVASLLTAQLEAGSVSSAVNALSAWLTERAREYPSIVPSDVNLRGLLLEFFKTTSSIVYKYSPKVLGVTVGIVWQTLLFMIFIFVLFCQGGRIYRTVMMLVPLKNEHKEILAGDISKVITGTFLGLIFTAFAQAALIWLGFSIAGISNPFLWGLVAIGVTLVPVVGGPLMYLPAVAALFIMGDWGRGLFLFLFGIFVVSMVDNIIKPLVMRGMVKVNPVLLALSMVGGAIWLGPSGIIVGPLVVVLMMAMIRIYEREFS